MLKDKIQDTLQMCEVDFAFHPDKKLWDAKNVGLALDQLLTQSFSFMIEESKLELALAALNAGIEHMKLTSIGEAGKRKFNLQRYTLDQFLRLDVAALKALNVFPGSSTADVASAGGSAGSLYGLLNQCKTQIGARLLKKWLKQPVSNAQEI
jgi:DNA mismatch repair protein MSH2